MEINLFDKVLIIKKLKINQNEKLKSKPCLQASERE